MTYSEWESRLVEELKDLPTAECIKITDYYKEMYSDRLEAGIPEEAILAEFGEPKLCAEKILADNTNDAKANSISSAIKKLTSSANCSPKGVILAILFTIFAGLPLAAVMLAAVVSLGATCIGSGACAVAGLVYIFTAMFSGAVPSGVAAHIGLGISALGLGVVCAIGLYFATKYTAIYCYKAMKFIYRGILK